MESETSICKACLRIVHLRFRPCAECGSFPFSLPSWAPPPPMVVAASFAASLIMVTISDMNAGIVSYSEV